jgi:hypothetical protein
VPDFSACVALMSNLLVTHPALGREDRMRIYVPNISSSVRTINPVSGYYEKRFRDTRIHV